MEGIEAFEHFTNSSALTKFYIVAGGGLSEETNNCVIVTLMHFIYKACMYLHVIYSKLW